VKFLIDTKLDEVVKMLEHKRVMLETNKVTYTTSMHDAQQYQYCVPGDPIYTKYGFGIIRMYRPEDKMVLCTLPFGEPAAKLWIKLDEVMKAEQARQRAEVLTHSLTHLLTYLLTHSLTHLLTHSLTHSLTHLLTHSLTHSLTYSLTHSLTHSPPH